MENMEWYYLLKKPKLNPPAWVFRPVWTVLYIMIAVSFWWFVKKGNLSEKTLALIFFSAQLVLNIIWPFVFFSMKKIGLAVWVLLALLIFLGLTIYSFYQYSVLASVLLVPYFIWSLFALWLNVMLWYLNM